MVYCLSCRSCHKVISHLLRNYLYNNKKCELKLKVLLMNALLYSSPLRKLATILAIAMFALCLFAAITGVAIAFYYTPSTTNAYSSIEYINNQVTNGWLIRSLHNIAGNGLIAVSQLSVIGSSIRVVVDPFGWDIYPLTRACRATFRSLNYRSSKFLVKSIVKIDLAQPMLHERNFSRFWLPLWKIMLV